jgi:hypothetical protein
MPMPSRRAAAEQVGRRLSYLEFGDYELLHLVDDNSGKDTAWLAEFMEANRRSTGSRLSWMKRQGLLTQDVTGGWLVALRGRRLLDSRGQDIEAIQALAKKVSHDKVSGWVAKREWARNLR